MKKQEEQDNKKKRFWGVILCLSFLALILLILILINPNGIINSSTTSEGSDIIKYMKENNISVYGDSKCPYCQKQLNEFKPYQTKAIEEGVFVFCDLTQDVGCVGVGPVPSWKINNKIVYEGYLKVDEISNLIESEGGLKNEN